MVIDGPDELRVKVGGGSLTLLLGHGQMQCKYLISAYICADEPN